MANSSSPITQVQQTPQIPTAAALQPQLLTKLALDLRGRRFSVDRDTVMNLPESILLCLFPNGLVLSRQSVAFSDNGEMDDEEEVYHVDFDPDCLVYILDFFKSSQEAFYGVNGQPGLYNAQQHLAESLPNPGEFNSHNHNPLITKQAIIVLREELEYFTIPPADDKSRTTDDHGFSSDYLLWLKRECGKVQLAKRNVFTALQRNVNKENNVAEQHLIDMLCMSGFDKDDSWGYRSIDPGRCCISSIALVLLKTGIVHHDEVLPDGTTEKQVTIDYGQMATAQKLLLFWRKPARKCWWDGIDVEVPSPEDANRMIPIKLWSRRVWTLELSLV